MDGSSLVDGAERAGRSGGLVEAVVEVFDAGAQVLAEHVLDAAADDPAEMGLGEAAESRV